MQCSQLENCYAQWLNGQSADSDTTEVAALLCDNTTTSESTECPQDDVSWYFFAGSPEERREQAMALWIKAPTDKETN